VLGRVINLAMPLTLGKLVSILEGHSSQSPWPFLFGYITLRFLQGNGGLSALRDVSAELQRDIILNLFCESLFGHR
jgi:hypothetical protein